MLSSRGHIKANLKPTALYCNALHTSDRAGSLQLLLYAWNFYGHNVNSFHGLLFTLAKNNFMEAIGDEWQTNIKYRVPEVRLESESFRTFRPWILPYTNFQVNIWSTAVSAVSVVTVGIGQTLRGVLETAIIAANNIDSFTPFKHRGSNHHHARAVFVPLMFTQSIKITNDFKYGGDRAFSYKNSFICDITDYQFNITEVAKDTNWTENWCFPLYL